MWPFSNSGKDTQEISAELPDGLRDFFFENNPDKTHGKTASPYQQRVNEVLVKNSTSEYDQEFDKYKRSEGLRKVVTINCAELQQKVVECYRGWTPLSTNECSEEIKKSTSCLELQKNAMKTLHYDECHNIKQCKQIRRVVDQLFVKHFGQFGDTINEQTQEEFKKDVDSVFFKVWR